MTPQTPLEGLETVVLRVWLENSPSLRKAHKANPQRVEQAVRQAVFDVHVEELRLRSQGLRQHEAQEFTRPAMWTPPTLL